MTSIVQDAATMYTELDKVRPRTLTWRELMVRIGYPNAAHASGSSWEYNRFNNVKLQAKLLAKAMGQIISTPKRQGVHPLDLGYRLTDEVGDRADSHGFAAGLVTQMSYVTTVLETEVGKLRVAERSPNVTPADKRYLANLRKSLVGEAATLDMAKDHFEARLP